MTPRTMILLAAGAAALLAPAAASAQQYGPYDNRPNGGSSQGYSQPGGDYGQPRGGYGYGRHAFPGYPEFNRFETHIRGEIQDGMRDDTLDREGAADLYAQLQQIRYDEMREYRAHGWNLPNYDRMRIREELRQLDQQVDRTRMQP